MTDRPDDLPEDLVPHGISAHEIDVLAAAIVIDMVESMRVGESGLEHVEGSALVVHEVDELLCVEFNTLVVLSEVDTSNL